MLISYEASSQHNNQNQIFNDNIFTVHKGYPYKSHIFTTRKKNMITKYERKDNVVYLFI